MNWNNLECVPRSNTSLEMISSRGYRRVERLSQGYTEGNFKDMTS